MTKTDVVRLLIALRPPPTTQPPVASPPTAPFVPTTPAELRVRDMVVAVFGSTRWASEVMAVPWRVVPDSHYALMGMAGAVGCTYSWTDTGGGSIRTSIQAEGWISETSATTFDQALLGDLIAHEGAHVIGCMRWPQTSAPPGFPNAADGAPPAEGFAECFARSHRGPTYRSSYGCASEELLGVAVRAATP